MLQLILPQHQRQRKVDFCKEIEHTWSQKHSSLFITLLDTKKTFYNQPGSTQSQNMLQLIFSQHQKKRKRLQLILVMTSGTKKNKFHNRTELIQSQKHSSLFYHGINNKVNCLITNPGLLNLNKMLQLIFAEALVTKKKVFFNQFEYSLSPNMLQLIFSSASVTKKKVLEPAGS